MRDVDALIDEAGSASEEEYDPLNDTCDTIGSQDDENEEFEEDLKRNNTNILVLATIK